MSTQSKIFDLLKDKMQIVNIVFILTIVLPILYPISMPIPISKEVRDAYEYIDALPDGTLAVYSVHLSASIWPEIGPPFTAVLNHIIEKDIEIVFISDAAQGPALIERGIELIGGKSKLGEYGEDWVLLGYLPGAFEVSLATFMEDSSIYSKDYYGNLVSELPLMSKLPAGKDADVFLGNVGGISTLEPVVRQAGPYLPIVVCGISSSGYSLSMPYYEAGALVGVVPPGSGGAAYEYLTGKPGLAMQTQVTLSFPNLFMVLVIILTNMSFLLKKVRGGT